MIRAVGKRRDESAAIQSVISRDKRELMRTRADYGRRRDRFRAVFSGSTREKCEDERSLTREEPENDRSIGAQAVNPDIARTSCCNGRGAAARNALKPSAVERLGEKRERARLEKSPTFLVDAARLLRAAEASIRGN